MTDSRSVPQLLLVPLLLLLGGVVAWVGGWHVIPERGSAVFPERWWAHVAGLLGLGGLLVGVMLLGISPGLWPGRPSG